MSPDGGPLPANSRAKGIERPSRINFGGLINVFRFLLRLVVRGVLVYVTITEEGNVTPTVDAK